MVAFSLIKPQLTQYNQLFYCYALVRFQTIEIDAVGDQISSFVSRIPGDAVRPFGISATANDLDRFSDEIVYSYRKPERLPYRESDFCVIIDWIRLIATKRDEFAGWLVLHF
jgi:hypothetical protein